jgi:hypothetical protein
MGLVTRYRRKINQFEAKDTPGENNNANRKSKRRDIQIEDAR